MTEFSIRRGFPRVRRSRSFSNGLLSGNLACAPTRLALVVIVPKLSFVVIVTIGQRYNPRLLGSGVVLGS